MNPWLTIPADDYENHMSSPEVEQLQALSRLFKNILERFKPSSLAVIGCAAGNGFEHIDPEISKRVLGVDINRDYLNILKKRHLQNMPGLSLRAVDVSVSEISDQTFDLVHAALIFEYADIGETLPRIQSILNPNGILTIVLQLPDPLSSPVSKTRYKSLERLNSIMKLADPTDMKKRLGEMNCREIHSDKIELKKGKKFFVGYYQKLI